MLLVDGCPNTVEDLRVYESGILDVSSTERIDLKTKLGLATEEVSEEVLDFLLTQGRATDPRGGAVGTLSWAASTQRRRIGISDVVVTRQLKRWHATHAIMLLYRDALHNQLNTRYGQQYAQYAELTQDARRQTERSGIGLVVTPIPKAGQPIITSVVAAVPAAIYYIRVSWVGPGGQEGQPSELTSYETVPGTVPVISVVGVPASVTGFNVFVGLSAEADLALQNSSPVALGGTFTIPGTLAAGRAPGNGQDPDLWVTGAQVVRRG